MTRAAALALALALPAVAAGAERSVVASVFVNPLELTLSLSTDRATVGQSVRAQATAANGGSASIVDVSLTLRHDPAGLAVAGSTTRVVDTIAAGSRIRTTWRICGVEPGRYVVLVAATFATLEGQLVTSESAARVLEVEPKPRARCALS